MRGRASGMTLSFASHGRVSLSLWFLAVFIRAWPHNQRDGKSLARDNLPLQTRIDSQSAPDFLLFGPNTNTFSIPAFRLSVTCVSRQVPVEHLSQHRHVRILDAAALVDDYRARLVQAVQTLNQHDCRPTVAVATLGDGLLEDRCRFFLTMGAQVHQQPVPLSGASRALGEQLRLWANEPRIHGILLQPELLEAYAEHELMLKVSPEKDIGCFHPVTRDRGWNQTGGFPCPLPSALAAILAQYEISLKGTQVCLVCDEIERGPDSLALQARPEEPAAPPGELLQPEPSRDSRSYGWLAPRKTLFTALVDFFLLQGAHLSIVAGPGQDHLALLSLARLTLVLEPLATPLLPSHLAPGTAVIDLRPMDLAFSARQLGLVASDFLGWGQSWPELERLMWMRNLVEASRLSHLGSRAQASGLSGAPLRRSSG
jgi:hypothetical protein